MSSKRKIKNPKTGRMVDADGIIGKQIRMERQLKRGTYKPVSDRGRGGKVRGWDVIKPNSGKEREDLYRVCGSSCFLKPSTKGYPICASLNRVPAGEHACKKQCSGIISAKVRSSQWRDQKVRSKADKLSKKYKC